MDEKEREAHLVYKNKFVHSLYLYSFIFLAVIAAMMVLIIGVSLILYSNEQRDLLWLYVSGGFALAGVIVTAILSAFLFVDTDGGYTLRRMKATNVVKAILRCLNALTAGWILVAAYQDATEGWWNGFMEGFSLVIIALEGIMFFYSLWHIAWMKENPGRYLSPAPAPTTGSAAEEVAKKTSQPVKKENENSVPAPVTSSVKKESAKKVLEPEPLKIVSKSNSKKSSRKALKK